MPQNNSTYLLYLDESEGEKFYTVAGIAIPSHLIYGLSRKIENLIAEKMPTYTPSEIELHGSPMHVGRAFWRKISKPTRIDLIENSLKLLGDGGTCQPFLSHSIKN